eukprot:scaffold3925_cov63-Phaeocystis_antarctica.AAC.2
MGCSSSCRRASARWSRTRRSWSVASAPPCQSAHSEATCPLRRRASQAALDAIVRSMAPG